VGAITCQLVAVKDVRPLRHSVLRAGQPPESCIWDGDDHPDTCHFAALDDGIVVAIGTLLHRPHELAPGPASWQLRGMATHPERRSQGLGTRVLAFMLNNCRNISGGEVVWCNARAGAVSFYTRHGFAIVSEEFTIPEVGLHVVMRRRLSTDLRTS
jgi:predicted GNAT family N-acyltransferase